MRRAAQKTAPSARPVFCLDRVSQTAGQPAQRVPYLAGGIRRRGQGVAAERRPGGLGQVPEVG